MPQISRKSNTCALKSVLRLSKRAECSINGHAMPIKPRRIGRAPGIDPFVQLHPWLFRVSHPTAQPSLCRESRRRLVCRCCSRADAGERSLHIRKRTPAGTRDGTPRTGLSSRQCELIVAHAGIAAPDPEAKTIALEFRAYCLKANTPELANRSPTSELMARMPASCCATMNSGPTDVSNVYST